MSPWVPLSAGPFDAVASRTDPYLWLAASLGGVDQAAAWLAPADRFEVAIEFMPGAADSSTALAGLHLAAAHGRSRFRTGTATVDACIELLGRSDVRRVMFAAASRTGRPETSWQPASRAIAPTPVARAYRNSRVLLGVIDTGCPFAHADLRKADGGLRVRALWDQGSGAHWAGLGSLPAEFGYGLSLGGADLQAALEISAHDLDVYRACGYGQVLRRGSHGAHTLGLLAGTRLWHLQPDPDRSGALLSVQLPRDAAGAADIAFVQLPHALVTCVSVSALEQRAIDGCRYILRHAQRHGYERVVINLGYESWVGPHDGSGWFEQALDAMVDETRASGSKTHMDVFLVAGNSKNRRVHAASEPDERDFDVLLAVQPGSETPTWLEFWVPDPAEGLQLQVTPPGGLAPLPALAWPFRCCWPASDHPAISVLTHDADAAGGRGHQILVRIAPTLVLDQRQKPAPSGVWRFELMAAQKFSAPVHAYVGRAAATLNAAPRGRQAAFVGRPRQARLRDEAGTLNGHAGGRLVHVCGAAYSPGFAGARLLQGTSTAYSGSGPMRNGARGGPDDAMAVEDSLYNPGVYGTGHASACLVRMAGTSVAAPLRARIAANTPKGTPPVPGPVDAEVGTGVIDRP